MKEGEKMGIKEFLGKVFSKAKITNTRGETITLTVPAELYYKELAMYTATSLIANAISRSDINVYVEGKMQRNEDFYLLNVSPNANETSSYFWHKVINKVVREGKCLVVRIKDKLFVADSYFEYSKSVLYGNTYAGVVVDDYQFLNVFDKTNSYMFRLDDKRIEDYMNGINESYSQMLSAAKKSFVRSHSYRYKLKIDGVRSGDDEFNKEFENTIFKRIKDYFETDDAVYPEFDGYVLTQDEGQKASYSSEDFLKLKKDLFETAFSTLHIPTVLISGNITNMKEIVSAFLSFGVDPFADMITEGLNKGAGVENYVKGNYYKVNTSVINHRDIFENAANISTLISCGYSCIDELRIANGDAPLNTKWSREHFLTKNFDFMSNSHNELNDEGGEKE